MALKVLATQALHPPANWDREFHETAMPYPGVHSGLELTAGGGMTVAIAVGKCLVAGSGGSSGTFQGSYHVLSDSSASVTCTAQHATLNRIDQIVLKILDAAELGTDPAQDGGVFQVVAGTPTSGATLTNVVGLGSVPTNSLVIGYVLVKSTSNGGGSIASGDLGGHLRLLARQRVLAHRSGSLAVTTGGGIAVTFDDVPVDSPNANAGVITTDMAKVYARQTGNYDLRAGANFVNTAGAGVWRFVGVRYNGTGGNYACAASGVQSGSNGVALSCAVDSFPMVAGQYVELFCATDNAGSVNVGFGFVYGGYLSLTLGR